MDTTALAVANSGASMVTTFITFGLIILIFYFLIIRPQRKKDKEQRLMIEAMKKGDKVVTIGGIHGTVVAVKESTVVIKVDDNARIEFAKAAVSSVTSSEKKATKKEKAALEMQKPEAKEEVKEETKTESEDK